MRPFGILLAPMLSIALLGCDDHTAGVHAATVSDPVAVSAGPAPSLRESLRIDAARSSVGFTGAKVTASHDGSFEDFDGTIELDPADVTASAVRVTIRMSSVRIEPARLAQHLLDADFFDVARFPTSTFESTAIESAAGALVGGERATHVITGNLTMRGVTRAIRFPAIVTVTPTEVRARSELSIDRRDFGIVYPGMADDLVRDLVVIRFDVRAPRAAR